MQGQPARMHQFLFVGETQREGKQCEGRLMFPVCSLPNPMAHDGIARCMRAQRVCCCTATCLRHRERRK